MKSFTLIRYNRNYPYTEMERLSIAEPRGYKELDYDIKRDLQTHGVFFEFSSDLEFYNYLITDAVGEQVEANAYDFIKNAYNEEATNTNLQLLVEEDNKVLFDLFLNMQKFKNDPINKIWSCNCETKEPFLLKEKQEQKINMVQNKIIQLRKTDVLNYNKATVNPDLNFVDVADNITSPPLDWTENNRDGLRQTESYGENEVFAFFDAPGVVDFRLHLLFATGAQMRASIILARDIDKTDIAYTFTQDSTAYTLVLTGVQLIDLQVSQYLNEKLYLFINIDQLTVSTSQYFLYEGVIKSIIDTLPYEIGETIYYGLEIFVHQVKNGTSCQGALLRDCFSQILSQNNLSLSSNVLFDDNDLGSVFITKGRRIAQAQTDTDLSLNFKDLFEQCQKMFNIGYGLQGSTVTIDSLDYFYKANIFLLDEVAELEISNDDTYCYNVLICGYEKYKEEKLGKIYQNESFHSKREYNIEKSNFGKKLDVRTKLIASMWTIEKLRRDIDKTDDEEIFVFALNRDGITSTEYSFDGTEATYPPSAVAEGYEAFDDVDNNYYGLVKENLFNIRLSPRRLIERFLPIVKTGLYKLPIGEQIAKFSTGEPKTQLKIQNLDENADIDFSNVTALFKPEKYILKSYLSESQFHDLKNNYRYSQIQFTVNQVVYKGYIITAKYNYNTGLLDMTLIAKSDE